MPGTVETRIAELGIVIPELAGKFDGLAMRVPVADGSIVDMTVELEQDVSLEQVKDAMYQASQDSLKGILSYCTDPIVSGDIIGNTHSSIFDAEQYLSADSEIARATFFSSS